MLSRLRLSPRSLWRVLVLLPPFIIVDSWALDAFAAYLVNEIIARPIQVFQAYALWAQYDFCAKWSVSCLIAHLLVSNLSALRPLGWPRLLAPWLSVLILLGAECYMRSQIDSDWLDGLLPGSGIWHYLVCPPYFDAARGGFSWASPTGAQTLWWALRPLTAFAVSSALLFAARVLVRFVARRAAIQSAV